MKVSELKAMLDKVPGHYEVGHAVVGVTGWVMELVDVRVDHDDQLCAICADKHSDAIQVDESNLNTMEVM
jgi:hypothetical protein